MNINSLIITPLSGAVIGYFTNWLAIKMLFRPYEEKRIFGMRLPFTPGLMPKERYRLSQKIGETLSEHVLSNDVIINSVLKNEKLIYRYLDKFDTSLRNSELNVSECCGLITNMQAKESLGELRVYLQKTIAETVKSPAAKENIVNFAEEFIIQLLKSENARNLAGSVVSELKPQVIGKVKDYFGSGAMQEFIEKTSNEFYDKLQANEKALAEIVPPKAVGFVKSAVKGKVPIFADFIKNLPYSNPEIDASLRKLIGKIADDNIGSLASMFINKDKLYSNIRLGLFEYLSQEENLEMISFKLEEIIDKFMSNGASHYLGMLPPDTKEQLQLKLQGILTDNVSDDLIDKMLQFVFDSIQTALVSDSGVDDGDGTIFELIKGFVPNFELNLRNYISVQVDNFCACRADILTEEIFKAAFDHVSKLKINELFNKISENNIAKIKELAATAAGYILKNGAHAVFAEIDIGKIAEEQINSFELQKAEEITLSVVNRELTAITYVGGILGFVIGFVPALLQFFGI